MEDKVDKVDMVDWPLPREGPRTEEQVNVLLTVKVDFANSSSSLFLDEGFLDLCSEKSSLELITGKNAYLSGQFVDKKTNHDLTCVCRDNKYKRAQ